MLEKGFKLSWVALPCKTGKLKGVFLKYPQPWPQPRTIKDSTKACWGFRLGGFRGKKRLELALEMFRETKEKKTWW